MIRISPADTETLLIGFWHFAAVFLRVGAATALLPAFGERSVPARVKIAVALGFSVAVGTVLPPAPLQPGLIPWSQLIVVETVIGFALGFVLRLFVLALQTAGTMAAQATSLSQILGGAAEPVPAIGYILVVAGLAVAVTAGLHVRAVEFLVLSYDLLPQGQWPNPRDLSGWGVSRIAQAFSLAFLLASPFVIVSALYNLTLGVINRAMPQLMVAFVGAPAVTLGSIVILALCAPAMLAVWLDAMGDFLAAPTGGMR